MRKSYKNQVKILILVVLVLLMSVSCSSTSKVYLFRNIGQVAYSDDRVEISFYTLESSDTPYLLNKELLLISKDNRSFDIKEVVAALKPVKLEDNIYRHVYKIKDINLVNINESVTIDRLSVKLDGGSKELDFGALEVYKVGSDNYLKGYFVEYDNKGNMKRFILDFDSEYKEVRNLIIDENVFQIKEMKFYLLPSSALINPEITSDKTSVDISFPINVKEFGNMSVDVKLSEQTLDSKTNLVFQPMIVCADGAQKAIYAANKSSRSKNMDSSQLKKLDLKSLMKEAQLFGK